MAKLIKRHARKPLVEGKLADPSWSNFTNEGELFSVSIGFNGDYQIKFSRQEATRLRDKLEDILQDPEFIREGFTSS